MNSSYNISVPRERHIIIHGQLGNIRAKINQLEHLLKTGEGEAFLPYLAELEVEFVYLTNYYPQLDGSLAAVASKPATGQEATNSPKTNQSLKDNKIRHALMDMRALMDAVHLGYTHEGHIACHLKVMLDKAWNAAAVVMNLDTLDDIPF